MRKFTNIFESINIHNNYFKYLIENILEKELGYELIKIENVGKFIKPLEWEDQKKLKSILNYANTNKSLLFKLSNKFNLNTNKELYNFIKDNKKELFVKGGKYFYTVLQCLNDTISKGEKNEEYAKKFLMENWKEKNCIARRTETDYEDDLIKGIDIYFTIDGGKREYTVQVKPLKLASLISDNFRVESSGVVKKYNVDYYIFVDRKNGILFMFRNNNVSFNNNYYIINKNELVVQRNDLPKEY